MAFNIRQTRPLFGPWIQESAKYMSVAIYGYVAVNTSSDCQIVKSRISSYKEIGIQEETIGNLWNWPSELLPKLPAAVCFSIHDRIHHIGTEYLLDYVDFSPSAEIPLPVEKESRLAMFERAIIYLFTPNSVSRLLVAVTDCCEINEVKFLDVQEWTSTWRSDLEVSSPPNILYVIHKDQ